MGDLLIPIRHKADEWEVSVRRVQKLCDSGRIPGAVKKGKCWYVPSKTQKPADTRKALESTEYEDERREKGDEFRRRALFELASHDIRSSLTTIIGYAHMVTLEHGPELNEQYANNIIGAGDEIQRLLINLLIMVELNRNSVVFRPESWDIEQIVDDAIEKSERLAKAKNIPIEKNINVEHRTIVADKWFMSWALSNILICGIAGSKNGDKILVSVDEEEKKKNSSTYVYRLIDSGTALDDEHMAHVFDLFHDNMVNSRIQNRRYDIGLPIVQRIVRFMHGKCEISSDGISGTCVTITIDHKYGNEEVIQQKENEGKIREYSDLKKSMYSGKRVLVVDDNEIERVVTKEILSASGFEVELADDGIACVSLVKSHPKGYYDMVLTDLYMPDMDGFSAAKIIKGFADKEKAAVPIVAMTASINASDVNKSKDCGMQGFIPKPFVLDQMFEIIKKVFDNANQKDVFIC